MKTARILSFILLGTTIGLSSCKDKAKITNATIDSLRQAGGLVPPIQAANIPQPIDSSLAIFQDTLFPPAGDYGSRTFFHLKNGMVYTGQAVNQKPTLSGDIIMAYFYHNDTDTSATLTNLYTFPYPQNNWKQSMTLFRKGISEEAYQFSNTNSDLKTAFHNSSKAESEKGAVYKLASNDIIAFKTERNQYGLIRVKHLIPGNNPYKSYLAFEMKVQR
jgi:hypothetical protein